MMTSKPVTVLPVRTAAEHAVATVRLHSLMDADDADGNAAEIQAQASLIEAYERTHLGYGHLSAHM